MIVYEIFTKRSLSGSLCKGRQRGKRLEVDNLSTLNCKRLSRGAGGALKPIGDAGRNPTGSAEADDVAVGFGSISHRSRGSLSSLAVARHASSNLNGTALPFTF